MYIFIYSILCLSCGVDVTKANLDWRWYIDRLLFSSIRNHPNDKVEIFETQARRYHNALSMYLSSLNMKYDMDTMYCRKPLENTIQDWNINVTQSPCGRLQVDWTHKTHTPNINQVFWNVSIKHSYNFHVNLTLSNVDLADSLKDCRSEGIRITEVKTDKDDLILPTICGDREYQLVFIFATTFTIEYYISPNLARARRQGLTKSFHTKGHFRATFQVFHKDLVSGRSPDSMLVLDAGVSKGSSDYVVINSTVFLSSIASQRIHNSISIHAIIVGEIGSSIIAALTYVKGHNSECFQMRAFDGPNERVDQLLRTNRPQYIKYRRPYQQYLHSLTANTNGDHVIFRRTTIHIMSVYIEMAAMSSCSMHIDDIKFVFYIDIYDYSHKRKIFVNDTGLLLSLPTNNNECRFSCVFELITNPGSFIQVSVAHYDISGFNPGCYFRGLLVYKWRKAVFAGVKRRAARLGISEDFLRPTAKICKDVISDHNGILSEMLIPNEYTSDMDMIRITWFSFPGGKFDIQLKINKSNCRGTFVQCTTFKKPESLSKIFDRVTHRSSAEYFAKYKSFPVPVNSGRSNKWLGTASFYHGILDIENGGTYQNNTFYVNLAYDCIVLQHIQLIASHSPYLTCVAGVTSVAGLRQEFSITVTLQIENVPQCNDYSSIKINYNRISFKHEQFQPSCGLVSIHLRRTYLDASAIFDNRDMDNLYQVFRDKWKRNSLRFLKILDDISVFYKDDNKHSLLLAESSINRIWSISHKQLDFYSQGRSFRFGHPLAQYFQEVSLHAVKYMTKITIGLSKTSGSACGRVGLRIVVFHRSFLSSTLYYQWHQVSVTESTNTIINDVMLYTHRTIAIQPDVGNILNGSCTLNIGFNPTTNINNFLRSYHKILDIPCCFEDYQRIYYVIWQDYARFHVNKNLSSWEDANEMCSSTDGHLFHITTENDISILENFILGSRFEVISGEHQRYPFLNHGRTMYQTLVFVGLKYKEVLTVFLLFSITFS